SSLGSTLVAGRKRVPNPATAMTALRISIALPSSWLTSARGELRTGVDAGGGVVGAGVDARRLLARHRRAQVAYHRRVRHHLLHHLLRHALLAVLRQLLRPLDRVDPQLHQPLARLAPPPHLHRD